MKSINSEYIESIVSTIIHITEGAYQARLANEIMPKYEKNEIELAEIEFDEKYRSFFQNINSEFEERLEDAIAYAIIKEGEFYFTIPAKYQDETAKCLNAAIENIFLDTFNKDIRDIFPPSVGVWVSGNAKSSKLIYEKYCGSIVEKSYKKEIKNEKNNQNER